MVCQLPNWKFASAENQFNQFFLIIQEQNFLCSLLRIEEEDVPVGSEFEDWKTQAINDEELVTCKWGMQCCTSFPQQLNYWCHLHPKIFQCQFFQYPISSTQALLLLTWKKTPKDYIHSFGFGNSQVGASDQALTDYISKWRKRNCQQRKQVGKRKKPICFWRWKETRQMLLLHWEQDQHGLIGEHHNHSLHHHTYQPQDHDPCAMSPLSPVHTTTIPSYHSIIRHIESKIPCSTTYSPRQNCHL